MTSPLDLFIQCHRPIVPTPSYRRGVSACSACRIQRVAAAPRHRIRQALLSARAVDGEPSGNVDVAYQ
jgi:hypothetical protein